MGEDDDEGDGKSKFPLDRRKENNEQKRDDKNNGQMMQTTSRKRDFEKILYQDGLNMDTYKVIIQKKKDENQRPSISHLKIGHILYKKMNVGGDIAESNKIGRNRVIVVCRNAETANKIVQNEELKVDHEVFIPFSFISRAAVIRDVDVEYSEEDLKNEIDSGPYKILSVKRMKRRMYKDGVMTFGDSQSVKIFFAGSQFPGAVYLWGVKLACEPFIPPLIQCFRCLRYNHTTNQCRGQRVCKMCGSKQEQHECQGETCINCRGTHKADSADCPEKKRQKTIKEMMAFQNLSFMEATAMLPRYNSRDMFSVVTSNRFQIFQNYNESFPEHTRNGPANTSTRSRVFEPYRPTAQARRRIGQPRGNQQKDTPKRRRNTPNNSPIEEQKEKRKCTEETQTAQREEEKKKNNKGQQLVGYEGLRQDRNYSKYEESNKCYQTQKQQESESKVNDKNDSRETLIDLNSSKESAMSHEDIGDTVNNIIGAGGTLGTNPESN
uniref:Uncharacterized protein n=1 Tax=Cacopsylla melanoneura TaxID=428564 RepID=A0A8D9BBB6_9HEMI